MKDPSPKADGLRAMREATRGHLQAKAEVPTPTEIVKSHIESTKAERLAALRKAAEQKLRPFAGKLNKGIAPSGPRTNAQKAMKTANKRRQRATKRRTELPPDA